MPAALAVEVTPYELSRLMQLYRSDTQLQNPVKDDALVTFYGADEQEEFEKFLQKQKVTYRKIGSNDSL